MSDIANQQAVQNTPIPKESDVTRSRDSRDQFWNNTHNSKKFALVTCSESGWYQLCWPQAEMCWRRLMLCCKTTHVRTLPSKLLTLSGNWISTCWSIFLDAWRYRIFDWNIRSNFKIYHYLLEFIDFHYNFNSLAHFSYTFMSKKYKQFKKFRSSLFYL